MTSPQGGDRMTALMDLMMRLPPQKIESTLPDLIKIAPDLSEDILCTIDQPLQVAYDTKVGREYLKCDYNRDGDSYRSPWSNTYYPPIEEGAMPSDKLREVEIKMNDAIDLYRKMYFDGGRSSAFFWDKDQGFAGVILIKKTSDSDAASGCWDSIHVVDVHERPSSKTSCYKLTSTVMVWLQTESDSIGYFNLGGSVTRINESDAPVETYDSHVGNIGQLIENAENRITVELKEVYFGTTANIFNSLRSTISASEQEQRHRLLQEVNTALQNKSHV